MQIIIFYHSLLSDWNNGDAHFLRGIVSECRYRGYEVEVYKPANGWSLNNLVTEQGTGSIRGFKKAYPGLTSTLYDPAALDLGEVLEKADLVIVHEWNDLELVRRGLSLSAILVCADLNRGAGISFGLQLFKY